MSKISPKKFLEFAKESLKEGREVDLVNTCSNLKRAMHGQVDQVLGHFSLLEKAKNRRMGFPERFKIVGGLGFKTPSSLKKFNKIRNVLEHDYEYQLDETLLRSLLDLIELYIEHTDLIINGVVKYSPGWKQRIGELFDKHSEYEKEFKIETSYKITESLQSSRGLEDYPEFFIKNGFKLVVGNDAPIEHVIALTNIAASLQSRMIDNKNQIIPMETGTSILSSEVQSLDQNFISVGNPDVNPTTAKIMGIDSEDRPYFDKNVASIRFYNLKNDKKAIVVIGGSTESIKGAARVLAEYKKYRLLGKEMRIKID